MNKSKYAVLLSNFLIQGRSNKNVLQKYLQWKWLIWKEHCMSSKVFFFNWSKRVFIVRGIWILCHVRLQCCDSWSNPSRTSCHMNYIPSDWTLSFSFKHLLHLPLLIFTDQCLVWMVPPWRACYRDERLLISIFSIWKWNWSCVKFGWLSAICVKICAFTMVTSKQNHNSYCHHLFALWDVS